MDVGMWVGVWIWVGVGVGMGVGVGGVGVRGEMGGCWHVELHIKFYDCYINFLFHFIFEYVKYFND